MTLVELNPNLPPKLGLKQENFHALLLQQFEQRSIADSLQKNRMKAWDRYMALGLPTRKTEMFRSISLDAFFSLPYHFTQVESLSQSQILPYILPECHHSVLVFVNGQYNSSLSDYSALPSQLIVTSLAEATATYGAFLNNHWTKSMKMEADPFAAINGALHQEGLFIYLPPKCDVVPPIQILHVIDTKNQPMLLMPRLQLFTGAHSNLSLVFTSAIISGSSYGVNQVIDAVVEENAHLHITQVTSSEQGCNCKTNGSQKIDDFVASSQGQLAGPSRADENMPEWAGEEARREMASKGRFYGVHEFCNCIQRNNWHFEALRAHLKKNSSLKCINMTQGSQTARYDYRVTFSGENAEASLEGIAMLAEKREAHVHVLMEHIAPHCRSNQLFKSALADQSRFSFEGKILVQELAQKTEAFQRICNLMLSETARVENKPNLKIFNHDVKASHGATVGALDAEQMHYLKTRGLSETMAKSLLIAGFLQERINSIPLASLRNMVSDQIQSYRG